MAVGAMITTINRAYNLRPRRNMFHQKMLAIGLTLSLSAILLVSAGIVLVGPRITHTVDGIPGEPLNVALVGTERDLHLAMIAAKPNFHSKRNHR